MKDKIMFFMGNSKVTLRTLQSLAGSLAFCTKALPAGRAISRRIYAATSKAKKPHHFIRVTNAMKCDLLVWKEFLEDFNGNPYIPEINWSSNYDLELYTDSAGGSSNGCAAFFKGNGFSCSGLQHGNHPCSQGYYVFRIDTDSISYLSLGSLVKKQKSYILLRQRSCSIYS